MQRSQILHRRSFAFARGVTQKWQRIDPATDRGDWARVYAEREVSAGRFRTFDDEESRIRSLCFVLSLAGRFDEPWHFLMLPQSQTHLPRPLGNRGIALMTDNSIFIEPSQADGRSSLVVIEGDGEGEGGGG